MLPLIKIWYRKHDRCVSIDKTHGHDAVDGTPFLVCKQNALSIY